MKRYPDHLCKNKITRITLWDRARKEQLKSTKAKSNEKDSAADAPPSPSTAQTWWNDEWLSGVEASLGNYPIVCRVEKSQAEFPPDPLADHKVVDSDGQIAWRVPDPAARAKVKKKAWLRLAVTLRPLTTVVPPTWTESGPVDRHSLTPPPPFTVVTFPSQSQPFLVPFAWGYISYHSLSPDDDVVFPNAKAEQKGRIKSFAALDGDFGSCRLEDKLGLITNMLGQWNQEDPATNESVPPQDALVIREFLTSYMSTTEDFPDEANSTKPRADVPFADFLRCTLPLWDGVSALKNVYDRRALQVQFWI